MVAYDLLSWNKSLPRHHMYTPKQALDHEPGLNPQGLTGAARYYDAQVEFPERLCLENVLDAQAHDALIRTYTEVIGFDLVAGAVHGAILRDVLTGEEAHVGAQVIVNVAGPWVDAVLAADPEVANNERYIGATKGTHIVVDPFPGAPRDALYVEATQDGRPYFIIPWNDLYLIGTTDVRFDGDPDNVHPSEEEIAYLLTETNLAIPAAGLNRESVRYAYAGLRPLPYQKEGAEGAITRRHVIHDHAPRVAGLISVIGGKLTTYRNLSEIVVNNVARRLGRTLLASSTAKDPLPGAGEGYADKADAFVARRPAWLSERSAWHLLHVYGIRARDIVELATREPDLQAVMHEGTGAIAAEVVFAVEEELAVTIEDIVYRRTMLGYARDASRTAWDAIETILRDRLGWSEERLAAGRARLERILAASKAHA